jgi:hypothetical protein
MRRATLLALLLDTIMGNALLLRLRALTGRKDERRRDRPIRHGARPVEVAASARAMSSVVVMSAKLVFRVRVAGAEAQRMWRPARAA